MSPVLRVLALAAAMMSGGFSGLWAGEAQAASNFRERIEMIGFRPYVDGELYEAVHKALATELDPYEKQEEGKKPRRLTLYIATVDLNRDGIAEILASTDRAMFEVNKGAENPPVYVFSVDEGATDLRTIGAFPAASVLLGSLYTGRYRNLLVNPDIRAPTRFISYRMNIDRQSYVVWEE